MSEVNCLPRYLSRKRKLHRLKRVISKNFFRSFLTTPTSSVVVATFPHSLKTVEFLFLLNLTKFICVQLLRFFNYVHSTPHWCRHKSCLSCFFNSNLFLDESSFWYEDNCFEDLPSKQSFSFLIVKKIAWLTFAESFLIKFYKEKGFFKRKSWSFAS